MKLNQKELLKLIQDCAEAEEVNPEDLAKLTDAFLQKGIINIENFMENFRTIDVNLALAFLNVIAYSDPQQSAILNLYLIQRLMKGEDIINGLQKLKFGPTSEQRKAAEPEEPEKTPEEKEQEEKAKEIVEGLNEKVPVASHDRRKPTKTHINNGRHLEIMSRMEVGDTIEVYPYFYNKDHPEWYIDLGSKSQLELNVIPLQFLLTEYLLKTIKIKPEHVEDVQKWLEEKEKAEELEASKPQQLDDWTTLSFSQGFGKNRDLQAESAADFAKRWLANEEKVGWWMDRAFNEHWSERDELRATLLREGYSGLIVEEVLDEFFLSPPAEPDPIQSELEKYLSSESSGIEERRLT